jgi:hypothetical protein
MMFRIQDKENVLLNSEKVTAYKIFEKIEGDTGFLYIGTGYCQGWDCSDAQCIRDWAEREDE